MKTCSASAPPRLPPQSSGFQAGSYLPAKPRWLLPAGLVAFAAALLFWFEPTHYPIYPACLFHQYTGLLCPGCGSLRALHQLLHGHLIAALHLNSLLVLALPALAVRRLFALHRQWMKGVSVPLFPPQWFWYGVALVGLFGFLRNLPFAHSLWLAP